MPRIPPVTQYGDEQWEILSKTLLDDDGRPLNVFATLAHHPRLLSRFNALGGLFLAKGTLPARERELVILRVAVRARSAYEFGQHTVIARRTGLTPDEITAVVHNGTLTAGDALLVRFTDELFDRDVVSDATWDDVAQQHRYDTQQMIELTLLVGFYRMLAGFLNSAEVESDAGMPGFPVGYQG
ncbi:MAG: carboxymuconolactone decarboxylase family protein [Nitriliruptorales bacterium]|nr:carboxymuconolactone decarboxylase family protein [Nitriliruptorales bacterium]